MAARTWDSLSPGYRARLLRNGVTRELYERAITKPAHSQDAAKHRAVVGYIRAMMVDRIHRKYMDRSEAAEYIRIAQRDFNWAKGFAALLHLQNQAIQETIDRRGENRGDQAGRHSRKLRKLMR